MFLNTRQEFSANVAYAIVEMGIDEEAVKRAVDGVMSMVDLEPSPGGQFAGVAQAIEVYAPMERTAPTALNINGGTHHATQSSPRYYALLMNINLQQVLQTQLGAVTNAGGVEGEAASMWATLKSAGRIVAFPHVTIVHYKSLPADIDLWNSCTALESLRPQPLFLAHLGHVVWSPHVMVLTVDKLEVVRNWDDGGRSIWKGEEFLAELTKEVKQRLHITVATLHEGVGMVQGKVLVEDWREGKTANYSGNIRSIALQNVIATGKINGLFA